MIKILTEADFAGFERIYNEFRSRAFEDYKFEVEPLGFEDFAGAARQGALHVIVNYENGAPSAFLIYTTAVSEAVELNVIYAQDGAQAGALAQEFLKLTENERKNKIVCYPMLGVQKDFAGDFYELGFRFTGTVVLRFIRDNSTSKAIFENLRLAPIAEGYAVTAWDEKYIGAAAEVVLEAFKDSPDALFDTRFKTLDGTRDIIDKIVNNVYAEFLPAAVSVLLYGQEPVGFCFVNLTGTAANIPLVAISKAYQGKGLAGHLLRRSMQKVFERSEFTPITEINVTTSADTLPALKMYRNAGFREDYIYPQAYL